MGIFLFLNIALSFRFEKRILGAVFRITEYSLHSQIKNWYSILGDEVEVKVDDYIVDIMRGNILIEIQTRNFSAIKKKLVNLLVSRKVRLVYPIAKLKWILCKSSQGEIIRKRRSPKKGHLFDIFNELVYVADLFNQGNFSFEVLFIEEEEIRCNDGKGSWRRKGISIKDRKLLEVFNQVLFNSRKDFLKFLPTDLENPFTNRILARKLGISVRVARRMTYSLRKMNILAITKNKKRELFFKIRNNV
ncbi:MAG: hypothetical protein AC479_06365 [miscellaneous Crenarchaeota group-6 archaeon AD8-1]|nr:MAG: hypothetical protein AC479_06365 [miscellaneous Crenarchaeota group-6 archaeon AD8-1]